jgi:hypothetical protein
LKKKNNLIMKFDEKLNMKKENWKMINEIWKMKNENLLSNLKKLSI